MFSVKYSFLQQILQLNNYIFKIQRQSIVILCRIVYNNLHGQYKRGKINMSDKTCMSLTEYKLELNQRFSRNLKFLMDQIGRAHV